MDHHSNPCTVDLSTVSDRQIAADAQRRSSRRPGFSLLEVVLSMALAVVLMGLISWSFQFYTRDMNVSNFDIQQTQLAAAVMQMIEDDLRATLHFDPIDNSSLEGLLASTGAAQLGGDVGGGGGGGGTTEDLSAAGIDSDIPTETAVEAELPDLTSGAAVLQAPGLIGNQFQIQVDVSRLPRLEEYYAMFDTDNTNIQDVPSDVKTVTYFVQPADSPAGVNDPLDTFNTSDEPTYTGGLVRRELDRAVTRYAASQGNLSQLNQTGEILAPEITGIEFEYWDGITWQMEWSSDDFEELPLAVRISLSMTDPQAIVAGLSPGDEYATRIFTHIVRLSMAKPIEEEEDELTEAGI
ncbi:MAG: type II secretion system protein [Pirellulaceae bacterium]|nr:type II secretion system protein [Pirellulaceae bacterium]